MILGSIKRTIKGAQIVSEWLGAGGEPIPRPKAEERAAICVACPKNVKGNWVDRLKGEVANTIREHLIVKDGVGLVLEHENQLGFCSKCGCALQLKVWVPIEHVMSHTPQHEVLEYPQFCWIRRELVAG